MKEDYRLRKRRKWRNAINRINIFIDGFKLSRRFNKIDKVLNILLKEYDKIDKDDIEIKKNFLYCIDIIFKYNSDLLNKIKEEFD